MLHSVFAAKISRGRTIKEMILTYLLAPTALSWVATGVLGGMNRWKSIPTYYFFSEEGFEHPVVLFDIGDHADEDVCRTIIPGIFCNFFAFIQFLDDGIIIFGKLPYHLIPFREFIHIS